MGGLVKETLAPSTYSLSTVQENLESPPCLLLWSQLFLMMLEGKLLLVVDTVHVIETIILLNV